MTNEEIATVESSSDYDDKVLEEFGRSLAWKEDLASLVARLEQVCQRPPARRQPQTLAFLEEAFGRLGLRDVSKHVRVDFEGALRMFKVAQQSRLEEELHLLAKISEHRRQQIGIK